MRDLREQSHRHGIKPRTRNNIMALTIGRKRRSRPAARIVDSRTRRENTQAHGIRRYRRCLGETLALSVALIEEKEKRRVVREWRARAGAEMVLPEGRNRRRR